MKKSFAVIGLGSFGYSIAEELIRLNADVVCIDIKQEQIQNISKLTQHAVICDATKVENLNELGIKNINHVIVCIGDDVQASILTTLILNDLGVKKITVKVKNSYHAKVVEKIGAHEVIYPEKLMGTRFARKIISDNFLELIEVTKEFSYVEIKIPKRFIGKSIIDLDIRKVFGVNVISIIRNGKITWPTEAGLLLKDDSLMLIGDTKHLMNLTSRF